MAEVTLDIGGRTYTVHCGDGEEAQLRRIGEMIDAKTAIAKQASPGLTEVRQLLFAAILLADELSETRAKYEKPQGSLDLPPKDAPESSAGEAVMAARMNVLAARIEALADTLAAAPASS